MFLNTDNIKKKRISYEKGDTFFDDKDGRIDFQDITSFFVSSVNHITNFVYEGHEYRLALGLSGKEGYYTLEASSNRPNSYATLCNIHNDIVDYMEGQLLSARDSGFAMVFSTFGNTHIISIDKGRIIVETCEVAPSLYNHGSAFEDFEDFEDDDFDAVYSDDFVEKKNVSFDVQSIVQSQDGQHMAFLGERNKVKLSLNEISNAHIFTVVANEMIPFQLKQESVLGINLRRLVIFVIITAGLNNWFGFYDGSEWLNTLGVFAGIMLGVWVMLKPVEYLVHRLCRNRMIKDVETRETPP